MTNLYYFDHAASAPRRDEVADAMQRGSTVLSAIRPDRTAPRERPDAPSRRLVTKSPPSWAPSGRRHLHGGGTESCHLAVTGVANHHRRHHDSTSIVVSRIEHHAVIDAVESMARDHPSVSVRYVDVDGDGVLDLVPWRRRCARHRGGERHVRQQRDRRASAARRLGSLARPSRERVPTHSDASPRHRGSIWPRRPRR